MAPEQAMGGEVTPRADLYALGAMLYEMVCGRPPFVGDESVAIIGQHLNTPPVAPSWHRPDCPPALEALILRLLEKDPQKRPASATEVRDALKSIPLSPLPREGEGQGEGAASRQSTTAPSAADPLYRTVFVGREAELKQLQSAFDAAVSGQGGLVMVVGEPGIGKTAVCQQLATYVSLRGGRTLVGHCYEEGSLSLPYLAFVEAMRTYVLARDPDGLKSDLGSGAADVARIVSEVRDRVAVELREAGDPEDDRWRLLQSVTTFLRNAAAVQPLVIVLEDLHWADRGTLDLLQHVARNLQGARLLVVGTYRDVEVDRAHPLSSALAELRRAGAFLRIPLRGLTVEEVQRMYEGARGTTITWDRAEAVHRQTEGNPLFVQEILRYMVEEGYVTREDGRWVLAEGTGPTSGIPEGLRDVVGKRLSRLSDKTNQVLSIAAVMGREFRLDVLQMASGLPEEELDAALEEAQERAIIEPRPSLGALAFRFTHAFFRQTLYEEIFASRRLRLHQQTARALETVYARRLDEHAPELAEHFAQSTDRADLEKALHYSRLAARRALGVFALAEAVRHLEQALKVQEVLDPDDKWLRCDLLLDLGEAQLPLGESRKVTDVIAPQAFELAQALGDRRRAAQACHQAIEGLHRSAPQSSWRTPEWAEWARRFDTEAEPDTPDRVHADLALGRVLVANGEVAKGVELFRQALSLSRRLDDREALFSAARLVIQHLSFQAGSWREAVTLAEEIVGMDWQGVSGRLQSLLLEFCGVALLQGGNRAEFDRLFGQLEEVGKRTRDAYSRVLVLSLEPIPAILDGRLEDAVAAMDRTQELADELGVPEMGRGFTSVRATAAWFHLGMFDEAGRSPFPGLESLCDAYQGRRQEARDALPGLLAGLGGWRMQGGASAEAMVVLQVAVAVRDVESITALLSRLGEDPPPNSVLSTASRDRTLAGAAACLGELEKARHLYDAALSDAAQIKNRPEVSLTRLEIAELLLEHYPDERDSAIEHLDFAIGEFREMKMQPSLERALRHRGLLRA
jgi:tetratricopeptide (TPR) repeat protein